MNDNKEITDLYSKIRLHRIDAVNPLSERTNNFIWTSEKTEKSNADYRFCYVSSMSDYGKRDVLFKMYNEWTTKSPA